MHKRFNEAFDSEANEMMEFTREALFESTGTCSREEIVAQIMMDNLFPHVLDPELGAGDDPCEKQTTEQKVILLKVASHMGPDWTQALYHAAVFMTKVA